jgi:ribosomal-protein-alanine N-acetyltransferase
MTPRPTDLEPQWLPLTVADAPALAALHAEAVAALGQEPWSAQAFADLLDLPATLGFKANIGGETAAFILGQAAGDDAEVLTLATALAFRRQGLAEGLIGLLRAHCRGRRCSALWLEVHAANSAAIALYKKSGFSVKGRRAQYYRDIRTGKRHAALIMRCHV